MTARLIACAVTMLLSACRGLQSSLAPAGRDAERTAELFWWMVTGTAVAWLGVSALALFYASRRSNARSVRRDRFLIIGGGVIVPTVTLTALLVYGLSMLPAAVARAPAGSLQVVITGEQWWWRVRYVRARGQVTLANEVRLPVDQTVQFRLDSDNVIHSLWIPSLAGKMDMIPGRTTFLTVRPSVTGVFRGVCAEYCGTSHALMAFYVEVLEPAAFDRWLDHQDTPARAPVEPLARRGQDLFTATGCHACHTIRGTSADGVIGPDLTHVGSRLSLAGGILPNEPDAIQRWIADPERLKPGVHMPRFGMLPDSDLRALAAYLEGLQ